MKWAFLYDRLGYNKWFAPLVDEALKRGYEVECWLSHQDISQTTKWYEVPFEEKMPAFRNGTPHYRTFADAAGLNELIRSTGSCVLFSIHPPKAEKPSGQFWVQVVSSLYDSPLGMSPEQLDRYDLIFFNCQHWLETLLAVYQHWHGMDPEGAVARSIRSKCSFVGTTQYDHFFLTNRKAFRQRIGFTDADKVVSVYMFETKNTFWCERIFHESSRLRRLLFVAALPFSYPGIKSKLGLKWFPKYLFYSLRDRLLYLKETFTSPSEKDVLVAVRKFCDRNGYKMLVKYRRKNPEKAELSALADHVVKFDDEFYPYTSAQVIDASDLVVVMYSTTVGECVFKGTPVLNVIPSSNFLYFGGYNDLMVRENPRGLERVLLDIYYNQEIGYYNFPGVVRSMTEREVVRSLPEMTLEDFRIDEAARKNFGELFLPPGLSPSAQRICGKIEAVLTAGAK